MRFITIDEYGGPEVLRLVTGDDPAPGHGEMRIAVRAAGVNAIDIETRSGRTKAVRLPAFIGREVAGVVEEVGAAVRSFRPGDEVFAIIDTAASGYADKVIVTDQAAALKPSNISFEEAASVPLSGLAAWQGLFEHGRLEPDQRVLIHGAAGGIGYLAVQIAKDIGTYVAATVSSDDIEAITNLGVDLAIDYETQKFEEVVSGMDLVLDLVGGDVEARSWPVLRREGILVSAVGTPRPTDARAHGVRATGFSVHPHRTQLEQFTALIEFGMIKPRIAATFPLERAAEAHRMLETEHVQGKIVLAAGD